MTLSFADATRALAQISADTQQFQDACGDQIKDAQDELDGVDTALRTVLAHHSHFKLPNGGFLYLKKCQSSRALNETRIAKAVDALTMAQVQALQRDHASWSPVQVLSEALADNLDAECVVRSTTPTITKKAPAAADVVWKPAPAAVVTQAERYTQLHDQLSVMRKHRATGRKRAAAVQAVAEPIVQAYLQDHQVSRQVVQFGGNNTTPTLLPLPALPMLPTVAPTASASIALPTIVPAATAEALQGQKVMFATRTYTARGKAPTLNEFIDALPSTLAPFASKDIMQIKKDMLKVLLDLFKEKYGAQQGSVKTRLVVKNIH
jgi:hypothetical protein